MNIGRSVETCSNIEYLFDDTDIKFEYKIEKDDWIYLFYNHNIKHLTKENIENKIKEAGITDWIAYKYGEAYIDNLTLHKDMKQNMIRIKKN